MSKLTILLLIAGLATLSLGCPGQVERDASQAPEVHGGNGSHDNTDEADSHEGHDHGEEPVAEDEDAGHDHQDLDVETDDHAGHDHDGVAEEDEPEGHNGGNAADAEEDHGHGGEDVEADEHAGHDHGDEAAGISLTSQQIHELGIASAPVGPGTLGREVELTGEVSINEDAVTHVSPRIGGIILKVFANLGDHVKAGSPLVELDSLELAEAKSDFLSASSRVELAEQTMQREEMLLEKGISAEQDYLEAKQAYKEELIAKRACEQRLLAMGLSESQLSEVVDSGANMTSYIVRSPVAGEVIEKHASLGENVGSDTDLFTIGDLSTVWVKLNIHQQDFLDIDEGMDVIVDAGHGVELVTGRIDYIEPLIGEETRTAVARVVLKRSSHVFRPGLFVSGYIEVGGGEVDLLVPREAIVDLDQDKLIFVREGTTFEPRVVTLGRLAASGAEVLSGIESGDEIVVSGAFQLKAELLKGTFDPHAGHAH